MWSSSLPTQLPRALRPLAHETVVTEDGPPPTAEPGAVTSRWGHRRSHGRATHVHCRAWPTELPTMRAKHAATLEQADWPHLGLQ